MHTLLILISLFVTTVVAIPIPNGVEGEPEIECGPTAITINFNTQNNFDGHVYVKGLYNAPECRTSDTGRQVAGITLPFDSCQVARTRSLNPRGVFVSTTVIITFHPQFLTKVDRAYNIQCFYMEADKTVDTNLEVSMLTTGMQTQTVPMPVCRYEILRQGPTGEPVTFALVGDMVYHKWTCDSETTDTFCMWVYGCYVDDKQGEQVQLLDDDGCALDKYVLNNLDYPSDLMAGVEAHVFKYADRNDLYFNCQIRIVVKEPNEVCPRPTCREPPNRKKRSDQTMLEALNDFNVIDVRAKMSTLDLDDQLPASNANLSYAPSRSSTAVCLQSSVFYTFLLLSVILSVTVVAISACLISKRDKQ